MKTMFTRAVTFATILIFSSVNLFAQTPTKWRGPNGNGVYNETGLLKEWPASGPDIIWSYDGLGEGHSSPAFANGTIYLSGMEDETGYVYALTTDGDDAVLTAFQNNNFSNNAKAPIQIGGENLYALDETSVFSDNGIQAVEIISGRVTFDNPGMISYSSLPIHFYGEAHLRTTVNFSEGVVCLFDAGLRLWVTNEGAIIAEGTSGNEVIFSSLDESPGAWRGIELQSPSTLNKLDYCHVKYGGSTGGRGANIYMFGSSNGSYLSLSNSYVGDSQTYGIYRASGSTTLNTSSVTYANNSSGDIYEE